MTAGPRTAAHATAKPGAGGVLTARAKRAKPRPGGGGGKAKPAANEDAADDAPDKASSSWTDKPTASDKADKADEEEALAPPAKTEKAK